MHVEILRSPPSSSLFTPLSTHQSQTPSSFFSSTPVLHFSNIKAILLLATPSSAAGPESALPPLFHGTAGGDDEQVVVKDVDVWVTSSNLILYSEAKGSGVGIPYPAISLHAIQRLRVPGEGETGERQGLYMQIETGEDGDYEEEGLWEITVVPSAMHGQSVPAMANTLEPNVEPTTATIGESAIPPPSNSITPDERPLIEQLFSAVSTCSNLHPDPVDDDDAGNDNSDDESEDPILFEGSVGYDSILPGVAGGSGGLPPPFPRSGGWITAENVGEFFDEEGSWRGRVRGREEEQEEGEEEEGSKWRRTG